MQYSFVTYIIATLISQTAGELFVTPRDTESKVGDTTYFNCSTNLESREIFWHHDDYYIYTGIGIHEPYHERFEIDRNASKGSHNLVIHSVQPGDAGQYVCVDDDGIGTKRSAQLVVLVKDPTCHTNVQPDGVIGQNVFNIPPDDVQLTCNVSYRGNIPPKMEWKKFGENNPTRDGVVSHVRYDNRVIYTLKLNGDMALDNSSYACQTTRATQNQYRCSSERIKVLYFVDGTETEQTAVIGEKITCVTQNNTMPCSSQWYHDNYTCPSPCNETITTHLLGMYSCTVKCNVRGTDYFHETLKVSVVEATTSPPWLISGKIMIAAVLPIAVIVILATLIAVLVILRKRSSLMKSEKERLILLAQIKSETKTLLQEAQISEKERQLQEARMIAGLSEERRLLAERSSDSEDEANNGDNRQHDKDTPHGIGSEEKPLLEARFKEALTEDLELQIMNADGKEPTETQTEATGVDKPLPSKQSDENDTVQTCKEDTIITEASKEMERAITGVAVLEELLYIVSDKCSEVKTFDLESFEFRKRYNLEELENPWDMASCELNKYLYIMDRRSSCKSNHIICADSDVKVLVQWSTGVEYGNLSVTSEGHIIITFCDSRRLIMYEPDGRRLYDVSLSKDIIHPTHVLKLSSGQLLISYGLNEDNMQRVCVLDESGEIMKFSFERMKTPGYLDVGKDGVVFVADQGNSRVCALNSDLELIGEVASRKDGLRSPQKICLDERNKKLFVVDNKDLEFRQRYGKLMIFSCEL